MFESIFQLLFEYRPVVFEQGEFRFDTLPESYATAALGAVVVAVTVATYRRAGTRARRRDRLILATLRLAVLAIVLLCLFRPVLVVKAAVPQQNFLGVLLDDSRSMQIADVRGEPRAAFVQREFGSAERALMKALSDRFVVRAFRFSSTATRLGSAKELTFEGSQTRLGAALESARQELAGLPVAGLVLVSDGADTSEASLTSSLLALKADGLPVFTIGIGRETLPRDIQIDRVTTPRKVLKATSLLVDLVITHTGYAGETITLDVEDGGRIVGSREVKLPADGSPAAVQVRAMAGEAGPRVFRFRVSRQPGELVTENNVREALIGVDDRREKILYFEGEPRFELKFIRRAVADDRNLQLVTLQRTADNKYLRLDVDNPDELVGGFPKTREELFAYRGLILGSIEAGAFTGDQLRMITEFADRRGGGLLMLGGPRTFGEGGYTGTPVADALPVVLERSTGSGQARALARLRVMPTRAGQAHAVTQIAGSESASLERWTELPQVTSVNAVAAVKPGGVVLLNGLDERKRSRPVLAFQRYGRGKTIAFSIQDSWLWQMHASMPVDDPTHENFWRQLLRWLVDAVPGTVEAHTTVDRVEPGEPVAITAEIVDPTFVELNDAQAVAHVTHPDGGSSDVPLEWTGARNGEYRGTFVATGQGSYEVQVEASRAGKPVGATVAHVRAAPGDAEYFDARLDAARLRRIADETGGRFYTPETVGGLPEDLKYAGRGVTTTEQRDLWHMPIVLALLLALTCAEWGYRRATGMA
ncbi:MAG: hypothetical protein HYX76_11135 [Acidobacteria bacterium]|nr:hypothetical protein [Acidobacteriota bacterium]